MTPDTETTAVLDRFHRALVAEIRSAHPEYLDRTFTVAEIYQNLVPYRSHRDVIGVEMNGDYEDALLRLLGGEGDYLVIESDPARQEIQAELATKNPNTGLYRDFAAVGVRLNPDRTDVAHAEPAESEAVDATPETAEDVAGDEADPSENGRGAHALSEEAEEEDRREPDGGEDTLEAEAEAEAKAEAEARAVVEEPAAQAALVDEPEDCPSCGDRLPDQTAVRFCPYCGADVQLVPCGACGEPLESDWRFCVSCGAAAGGG